MKEEENVMKRQMKIISTLLIVITLMATLSTVVLAAPDLSEKIDEIAQGDSSVQTSKLTDLGKTIVTIMQTVGIVVAVVVLLVLGIKYMMGSAEEKAEYKKTMMPYLVGALLIFAAVTIANMVYNFTSTLK